MYSLHAARCRLIHPPDDGIVVVMATGEQNGQRTALKAQLIEALDDLVANGRHHAARIEEAMARRDRAAHPDRSHARETPPRYGDNGFTERFDRLDRALAGLADTVSGIQRELAQVKGELAQMKDELSEVKAAVAQVTADLTEVTRDVAGLNVGMSALRHEVTDIRERMATKVELEEARDEVKRMADGYWTTQGRLDRVADLLKTFVVSG